MKNFFKHLKTVYTHRKYVRRMCFKLGIPWRGLVHDLSKYSIAELKIAKYYIGTKSPHDVCREKLGYSPCWMHHYQKNKHHWQYWLDITDWPNNVVAVRMPFKYLIEMFCDQVGASKAYNKNNWNEKMVWDYWIKACKGKRLMHRDSTYLLEKLFWNYYQLGEKHFVDWFKRAKHYLKKDYNDGNILNDLMIPLESTNKEGE